MIDVREQLVNLVTTATGFNCYYLSPPKEATFPCIVYNEVSNSDYAVVLNNEYANIAYTFTVYAIDPVDIFAIIKTIDEELGNIGYRKDYTSPDMYSEGYYSKTLRFKAIVNHNGDIYNN